MLEDSLFESRDRPKTRKPMTIVISAGAHMVTVAILVLIPLFHTQAITTPPLDLALWMPQTESPKAPEVVRAQPHVQRYVQVAPDVFTSPGRVPSEIAYVDEPKVPALNSPLSSGRGTESLIRELFYRDLPETGPAPILLPPPLPPPPPAARAQPFRVGGDVQKANLIHQVNPVYPALARQARVQGAVQLEAVISKEGTIESLRVISGHPLLTEAALDAVRQWRYRPTLLNGDPVEVITNVIVTFTFR